MMKVLFLALLAAAAVFLGVRFFHQDDRRGQICFGVCGGLLALAFWLGLRLEAADETGFAAIALGVLVSALLAPGMGEGLWWLSRKLEHSKPGRDVSLRKVFWLSAAILFVCWLPVALAYYPGCFAYDMDGQMSQVLYQMYSMHHPLSHTLIVGAFYTLGGTVGVFACALLQMASLAMALAYGLTHLSRIHAPRWLVIALLALFALAPQHSVLSIGFTKDVPFAIFITVAMVDLHRKRPWHFALFLALSCLMRNNMIYALIPFAAILLIGKRKRMLAAVLAAAIAACGVNAVLAKITNAEDSPTVEMFSVPAQQLSRILYKHGYDVPTSYEVVEWVPNAQDYQASRADFTKLHLKVNREGELTGFLKFWARELFHYPIEYIDAFLLNTKGYWDPLDTSFAYVYPEGAQPGPGALVTDQYTHFDIDYHSFLPGLKALFETLYSEGNQWQHIPGLYTALHPATYTWMLLWALAWAIWRKRWDAALAGGFLLAYFLTLLLGPCVLVRYSYYLMTSAPILVGMLSAKKP